MPAFHYRCLARKIYEFENCHRKLRNSKSFQCAAPCCPHVTALRQAERGPPRTTLTKSRAAPAAPTTITLAYWTGGITICGECPTIENMPYNNGSFDWTGDCGFSCHKLRSTQICCCASDIDCIVAGGHVSRRRHQCCDYAVVALAHSCTPYGIRAFIHSTVIARSETHKRHEYTSWQTPVVFLLLCLSFDNTCGIKCHNTAVPFFDSCFRPSSCVTCNVTSYDTAVPFLRLPFHDQV